MRREKEQDGDLVTHVNPVRVRVKGEGSLQTTLFNTGEDATDNALLADSTLSATTSRSVNVLANFHGEKLSIDFRTTELDEWFAITNIWAYVKESSASYPQL